MQIYLDCFPGGKSKALTMSYDDGTIHDRRLVEIFNRYGIKGTFHLISGRFGRENYLSSSEVNSLFSGHEISAHTYSHPQLVSIPNEIIAEEIMNDRKILEELAGYPISGMSYPYGSYDDNVVNVLSSLGIEYSRTVKSHKNFNLPENFLTWHPTCHHRDDVLDIAKKFLEYAPKGKMSLLYVWGHSYEFDRNNNWELIEDFCKLMSNNTEIWYATNIEIVNYLKALKNLKFSASGSMAANPSAISVWVRVNGSPVEIPSGQVVKLEG